MLSAVAVDQMMDLLNMELNVVSLWLRDQKGGRFTHAYNSVKRKSGIILRVLHIILWPWLIFMKYFMVLSISRVTDMRHKFWFKDKGKVKTWIDPSDGWIHCLCLSYSCTFVTWFDTFPHLCRIYIVWEWRHFNALLSVYLLNHVCDNILVK